MKDLRSLSPGEYNAALLERLDADETPRLAPAMPRPRAREITPVLSLADDCPILVPKRADDANASMERIAEAAWRGLTGIGEGTTVLHAPSGVVGVVKKVHGPGEYLVKPAGVETSGRPPSEPVVELEDGNAFLLRRGSFVVLDARALGFREVCETYLASALANAASYARVAGIDSQIALMVWQLVIRAYLRAPVAKENARAAEVESEHASAVHEEANRIPLRRVAEPEECCGEHGTGSGQHWNDCENNPDATD